MQYKKRRPLNLYCKTQYNSGMTKAQVLQIRLTDAEKQGFQMAADLAGIPLSAWVRERLRFASIRELESAGQKIPFIEPIHLAEPHA
jgi:hypothetical protein